MFKRVMSHKRYCKKMLEKILQVKIRDIRYLEEEKTIKTAYESKGIRLDVYVEDDKNTVYMDMQVRNRNILSVQREMTIYVVDEVFCAHMIKRARE